MDWYNEIRKGIQSAIKDDHYWIDCIENVYSSNTENTIHLAILVEPYLKFIFEGKKTIESRFSINRCAPYQSVKTGDLILFKQSSGPIVGICKIQQVWFFDLTITALDYIRDEFSTELCIADPLFWENKKEASFATLMKLHDIKPISPFYCNKKDRRGWVTLNTFNQQLEFNYKELGISF